MPRERSARGDRACILAGKRWSNQVTRGDLSEEAVYQGQRLLLWGWCRASASGALAFPGLQGEGRGGHHNQEAARAAREGPLDRSCDSGPWRKEVGARQPGREGAGSEVPRLLLPPAPHLLLLSPLEPDTTQRTPPRARDRRGRVALRAGGTAEGLALGI